MRSVTPLTAAAVLALATPALAQGQDTDPGVQATAFLEQLEGEWSMTAEATPGPGRAPVRTEGRQVARLLGGHWLIAETNSRPDGRPFTSILTLETEGPILGDPTRTAEYREIIEMEGPDHWVMRSMILGPDGQWFEFAHADHPAAPPFEEALAEDGIPFTTFQVDDCRAEFERLKGLDSID